VKGKRGGGLKVISVRGGVLLGTGGYAEGNPKETGHGRLLLARNGRGREASRIDSRENSLQESCGRREVERAKEPMATRRRKVRGYVEEKGGGGLLPGYGGRNAMWEGRRNAPRRKGEGSQA